jgi:NAD(P)-dependent dehydrogenase (short-subunit alcohol dehydrogenase family)
MADSLRPGEGKAAFVTGASSGMGKAIAKRLIRDGYMVFASARRVDEMADLAAEGARVLRIDMADEAEIEREIASVDDGIVHDYGGIDVLVNNAGFGLYGAVEDTALKDARYQFEVNLFGLARLTQLLLPAMRAKGSGTIVNISSMGGKMYTPLGAWYHASKHALEGWSDCLRIELASFGIRVVIVEPGLIATGFGGLAGPLMERSGRGAYARMAKAIARTTEASYGKGNGTDPSVVADVVARAAAARRPRTRYVVGKYAKPLIIARTWLGDRMFDRVIMSQVR